MSFNTDECAVLRLHPRRAKYNDVQYQLSGEPLRSVSNQRDIGVIVDETLKPQLQCAKAVKSANLIMSAIKVSLMNVTPALFDKLYETFIRPHFEYSF